MAPLLPSSATRCASSTSKLCARDISSSCAARSINASPPNSKSHPDGHSERSLHSERRRNATIGSGIHHPHPGLPLEGEGDKRRLSALPFKGRVGWGWFSE